MKLLALLALLLAEAPGWCLDLPPSGDTNTPSKFDMPHVLHGMEAHPPADYPYTPPAPQGAQPTRRMAAEPTGPPPVQYAYVTNPIVKPLQVLRIIPIETPCPECGGSNHHEIHIETDEVYDQISVIIATPFHSSTVFDHYGTTNTIVATNVVLRVPLPPTPPPIQPAMHQQPGWTHPPSK